VAPRHNLPARERSKIPRNLEGVDALSRVRTVAATEILLVVGLVLFVVAAHVVERVLGIDGPVSVNKPMAIVMAAVPGLLWLVYFYLQDRHEPEPKHFVFGVYLAGAFVAAPMAYFLVDLARPAAGPGASIATLSGDNLVWAFLIVALAQETSKYVVVRYSVYLSPEFDEPMDGIVYMTAAGIGFATYQNYHYLQGLDGSVFLSAGAANTVVVTLAHACFAGVLGYALGRAKFSTVDPVRRSLILLAGLLVAVALNGQFGLLEGIVKSTGLEVQPWRGVAYAAGFAAAVFFVTSLLMRQHLSASPHADASGEAAP
jgi:RsiW-degrading membrane proteinase PrsW (M82 family)